MADSKKNKRVQRMLGEIISHKTDKTAVVLVSTPKFHPKYHKRYLVRKKYLVHDPKNEYQSGDWVEIEPCRPISKRKRFIIIRKV